MFSPPPEFLLGLQVFKIWQLLVEDVNQHTHTQGGDGFTRLTLIYLIVKSVDTRLVSIGQLFESGRVWAKNGVESVASFKNNSDYHIIKWQQHVTWALSSWGSQMASDNKVLSQGGDIQHSRISIIFRVSGNPPPELRKRLPLRTEGYLSASLLSGHISPSAANSTLWLACWNFLTISSGPPAKIRS